MVTQMGMSDELGSVDFNSDYSRLSSETKMNIEREVRRLIEEGRERATKLLTEKRKELDMLAKALVDYETLNKEEMEKIVRGEKLTGKMVAIPNLPIKLPESLLSASFGGKGSTGEAAGAKVAGAEGRPS